MKFICSLLAVCCVLVLVSCNSIEARKYDRSDPNFKELLRKVNKDGVHNMLNIEDAVPDKETAVKITKAVLIPYYSEEEINGGAYNCDLVEDSVWYVSLTYEDILWELEIVVYALIQKKDGKVLFIEQVVRDE